MKTRIAIALFVSTVVYGTPAGVLTWTGDAMIGYCQDTTEFNCGSRYGPLQLMNDPTGITSAYNAWDGAGSIVASYDVGRAFTVTSPGDFLFTDSVSITGSGLQCSVIGFCGLGGAMRMDFEANGLTGSTTGSAFDGLVLGTLSANSSYIAFLASGDYTLWQEMSTEAFTEGSTSLGLSYSSDVVGIDPPDPVPEPRLAGLVLLLVLAAALYKPQFNPTFG